MLLGVGQPRVSHFPDLCTLLYTYLSTLDYWTKIVYYLFTQTSPVAHTSALTPTYIKSQKLPNWPISKELGLGRMLLPHWKLLLTNQKIISVIFWLVHIIQSDSYVNSQSNLIGAKRNPVTWLVGNPRFSLVVDNRFWLVNGAGPIRPWSDFVGCDHVSRGWEQWGVSRTRLSWPMCWVLGGLVQYGKECGTFVQSSCG